MTEQKPKYELTEPQLRTVAEEQREQLDLLKRTVAKDLTDLEFELFVTVANRLGLDPFMRQIYAVKRYDSREKKKVMTIQTGIDGYRLLADRTGRCAGIEDAKFLEDEREPKPYAATVTVYKLVDGLRCPFTATARWNEYMQTTKEGKLTLMWRTMPYLMLGKCAEALALRKAFPAELSGVYTDTEMMQANNGDVIEGKLVEEPKEQPKPEPAAEAEFANDWIGDAKTRGAFWAATNELSLTHEEVHKACGVESMKQFNGSYDDAIAECQAYVAAQLDEAKAEIVQATQADADQGDALDQAKF